MTPTQREDPPFKYQRESDRFGLHPCLVVHSDVVRNSIYFGGDSGHQKLSAIAYITRNHAEGDYFYAFSISWSYTADQDYAIMDITTDIRLPYGDPAPIDESSSVIYKVNVIELHVVVRCDIRRKANLRYALIALAT